MLFDQEFNIKYGLNETGYELGIILISNYRRLLIYSSSIISYLDFLHQVKLASSSSIYLI
jgi:hypothetical protein